jgi:hypothetical protein
MQRHEETWYWMHFENRFLRLKREAFQGWFVEIMELAYPGDFTGTRQGTSKGGGDLSCDGFRQSNGCVYAVYAPRECGLKELNDKITSDLQSAVLHFGDRMRKWVFVHNDEQPSTETLLVLAGLNTAFPSVEVGEFVKKESLWEIVKQLSDGNLRRLFPPFPDTFTVDHIGFKDIQPVLRHLETASVPLELYISPPSPKKLSYNGFSPDSEEWLRRGRRKARLVGQYFETNVVNPGLGEEIAERYRQRYQELDTAEWPSDEILRELYGFTGGFRFQDQHEQAAVLAVLAYFFELCDIFKNPPEETLA